MEGQVCGNAEAPLPFGPPDLRLRTSTQPQGYFSGLLSVEAEVLAPAKALVNGGSIRIVPQRQVKFLHILFEGHEILNAEGAATESLLLGDVARGTLGGMPGALPPACLERGGEIRAARRILNVQEAITLGAIADKQRGKLHMHKLTA